MSLLVFLALNGQASASDEYMDVYLQVGVYTDQIIYFSKDSDTKKTTVWIKDKGDTIQGIEYSSDNYRGVYINGTPRKNGKYNFTYKKPGFIFSDYAYVTVYVAEPTITLNPSSLAPGKIGLAYKETALSASGGISPYTYKVEKLPDGLTFNYGKISGKPTKAGSTEVTVTVTDAENYTATKTYPLVIAAAPTIVITPATLPSSKVGLVYNETTLSASGGISPYTYKVEKLPYGLTFTNGKISGKPTKAGSTEVTVTVTDAENYTATKTYPLVIAAAPTIVITPATLPSGKVGLVYNETTLSASGGSSPYTYKAEKLPDGLTFTNGKITGKPTKAGSTEVAVTVTDAENYTTTKIYPLVIATAPTIVITPDTLPMGIVGQAYMQKLSASGSVGPYKFSYSNLAQGLSADEEGNITGKPATYGSYNLYVNVTDSLGYSMQTSRMIRTYNILKLTMQRLPKGVVGQAYAQRLSATGGDGNYTFTMSDNPAWLTLSADGQLTGTPTEAGSVTFKVMVADGAGQKSEEKQYQLHINDALTLTTRILPSGKVGLTYKETILTASGGTKPYHFSAADLPDGLMLKGDTISGTPTKVGSTEVAVTVTDAENYTGTKTFPLVIAAAPTIVITPATLPSGKVGLVYEETMLSASGGSSPYTYKVEKLPEGLTFTNGKITGKPTKAGSTEVAVTVTDAESYTATKTYPLVIAAAPTIVITPATLPSGRVALVYQETMLSASGGTAPYSFIADKLSEGLTLTKEGKLSGTPTKAGTTTVTVTATDVEHYSAQKPYMLVIAEGFPEAQSHEMNVVSGTSGTIDLTEGAIRGPFTSAQIVTAPDPSSGHAFIAGEGNKYFLHFTASPTFAGSTRLTYSLSNAQGWSAPALVTITVMARPDPSKDAEVIGLVRAQVDAANQLARTQIGNFNQRLEQLHNEGECRTNSLSIGVGIDDQTMRPDLNILDKLRQKSANDRCSEFQQRFAIWTNGEIASGSRDDDEAGKQKHSSAGVSGGIDYRFSPSFIGGIGFGYGRIITDIGENGTQNKGSLFSTALYGSFRPDENIFLDAVAGYGWLQFDSNRYVTATGENASGERSGGQLFGSLTLGYEYRQDNWLVSSYTRINMAYTRLNRFSETGAGIYNLAFDNQTIDLFSTTIGLRTEYEIPMDWGTMKPRIRLEYTRDFAGSSLARMGYADIEGFMPYAIDTDSSLQNSFGIEAGLDVQINSGWTVGFDYSPQIGTSSHAIQQSYHWTLSKKFN